MRPLELAMESFRSFASQTIDFRPHGLVVISGDTGAGKTSILDAICFGLYGRTPEQSGPRELLTLGAAHGEVRLTFSTDAGVWRVSRRIGRAAPEPTHLLERLSDDPGQVTDRVTGAATVNARLVDLVGMGFHAFTSAVLLAQGRFAQFLQATPRERDDILRELFDVASLEGARTAAQAMRDAAGREAEVLDRERGLLPIHTTAARTAQSAVARGAAARLAALRPLRGLVEAAGLHRSLAGEAAAAAARVEAALAELPPPAARAAIVDLHGGAEREAETAHRRCREAQEALGDALEARDRTQARHGGTAAELAALRVLAEQAVVARETIPVEQESVREQEDDLDRQRERLERLRNEVVAARLEREALQSLADALGGLAAARERERASATGVADAVGRRDLARQQARRATDDASVADAALDELRRAHLAASMRADLATGEPCPVCGQLVHVVPDHRPPDLHDVEEGVLALRERAERAAERLLGADAEARAAKLAHDATVSALAEAERRVRARGGDVGVDAAEAARRKVDAAQRGAEAAGPEEEIRSLAVQLERAAGRLAEARRRLGRDRDALAALERRLGDRAGADDPVAGLDRAIRELDSHDQAVEGAATRAHGAAAQMTDAERAVGAIERGELAGLRQSLALLAGRLGLEPPPADGPARELAMRADELSGQAERVAADAARRAAEARAAAEELDALIGERGAAFGVQAPGDFAARHRAAMDEAREAQSDLATLERHATAGRRLARALAAARDEARLYGQVAGDLQANRFPRYLLTRFHGRLAVGASARLETLSHGAFSFAGEDPDPLAVVDHRRGGRVRGAGTLSGGERFLASLALALALAEIASGSTGRLDCLFLDEGFSSLDGESLEVAITAVERMADHGRLVVVITHLPGVAERLGAAIRVRKDPDGRSHVSDRVELSA